MNRMLTNEVFLERAAEASPTVQVKGKYSGHSGRVLTECKSCGYQWRPIGGQLLRGVGCPKCAGNARLSIEELRARVQKRHPHIEVSGEYKNQDSRIQCQCSICGHSWETSAASLSNGTGCPSCCGNMRKSTESFIGDLSKVNPSIEVLGEYANTKTPIALECKKCGWEWMASPGSVLAGSGCPNCAGRPEKSTELFKMQLADRHPDIILLGEYKNVHSKTRFQHLTCGYEWLAEPNGVLNRGNGCPRCGRERTAASRRKTHDEFVSELSAANPSIEVIGRYETTHKKVELRCLRCGNRWSAEPNSVLGAGTGCPACHKGATSFAEQFIRYSFEEAFGSQAVFSRDRKAIGLELDVLVPTAHLAVEYGAWHWHKSQVAKDLEKIKRCADKGIDLIVVYDGYPFSELPYDGCIVFSESLGEQSNRRELKQLVNRILSSADGGLPIEDSRWEAIEEKAREASSRISTEAFKRRVSSVNPNIEILGEYSGSAGHVQVKCTICGHEWAPIGDSLVRGQGCPKCAGNLQKTHERFMDEMSSLHPDISVMSEYVNSKTRIACQCQTCGSVWRTTPISLVSQGTGCPECGRKRALETRRIASAERFREKMGELHPSVAVIGEYKSSRQPVLCRCNICGHEWQDAPVNITNRRHGCPQWRKHEDAN